MTESDLDILTASLDEREATADTNAGTTKTATPVLGFLGISVGFAALIGLSIGAVTALWIVLFGRTLLFSIGPWFGWLAFSLTGTPG
ncbi:hypothetical protein [Humibacter ginsenosidimutans]|uniref:Uncharacterized protein n=1 Tax=Humibacter ginsenosidimutans TaxID=2599293 RepID=A0A5B8M615_9MICO|nr:hypothetical protein [Humibacter ginsenosidimutans]QDZ15549.1 hypothetical protein FPZ11_12955 [Humibacter ginsenosidimutans]